ncbi:MAG: cyanophycinase [Phycisphaerales bacterium]|nr:MAG: cyanophycinase [Phycisphaerales bacterium]
MKMNSALRGVVGVLVALAMAACASNRDARGRGQGSDSREGAGRAGHLLIIGGGLDDDNRPVYDRLIELARHSAGSAREPRILIATAASLDQEANSKGKTESILAYCPTCRIDTITRETPTEETVALVDAADAMFFTGGDQKRITARYLKDDADTPESLAMRRLLARGGTIAGTSAGDAMMSDPMFLTGRSAEALGIRSTRTSKGPDDDADEKSTRPPLGPRIGKGMGFLPWAITDSHFFERHRFGRLVAALETSGTRLGIGVGEDACVEVDLATGDLIGVSVADSLLVDAGGVRRDGLSRSNLRALVIQQGARVSLLARLESSIPQPPPRPDATEDHPIVEPGQNRQLASWRFFLRAQQDTSTVNQSTEHRPTPDHPATAQHLQLDGYNQTAWPDGTGWSIVEITPATNHADH